MPRHLIGLAPKSVNKTLSVRPFPLTIKTEKLDTHTAGEPATNLSSKRALVATPPNSKLV